MIPHPDHDGLQTVSVERGPRYPDHEGLNHVPHSDKVAVLPPSNEKQAYYSEQNGYTDQHGYADHGKNNVGATATPVKSKKRYCGMKKWVAILVAVLIVLVIALAAGIGAGVGMKSSGKEQILTSTTSSASQAGVSTRTVAPSGSPISSSSSTTPATGTSIDDSKTRTKTSTRSASTATQTSGMGFNNCPSNNGTIYTSGLSPLTYQIVCNVDQPTGVDSINGGKVIDLNKGLIATSIEACIDLCVGAYVGGAQCNAVTYGANITRALSRGGVSGNCFLKNARAAQFSPDNSGNVVSAFRI